MDHREKDWNGNLLKYFLYAEQSVDALTSIQKHPFYWKNKFEKDWSNEKSLANS